MISMMETNLWFSVPPDVVEEKHFGTDFLVQMRLRHLQSTCKQCCGAGAAKDSIIFLAGSEVVGTALKYFNFLNFIYT
jgi:hypothetical protein